MTLLDWSLESSHLKSLWKANDSSTLTVLFIRRNLAMRDLTVNFNLAIVACCPCPGFVSAVKRRGAV
jgi:hypothetical protein